MKSFCFPLITSFFLVILFSFTALCGHQLIPPGSGRVPEYSNPQTPVIVRVGQQFSISLESNATTGYKWQMATPVPGGIIKLVTTRFAPPGTNLIGAPGRQKWLFQATGPGRTVIRLEYARPWEKNTAPAKRAVFNVIVR